MDGWKIPKQFGVKRQLDTGALLSAVQMKAEMKPNPVLMTAVITHSDMRDFEGLIKTQPLLWLS